MKLPSKNEIRTSLQILISLIAVIAAKYGPLIAAAVFGAAEK